MHNDDASVSELLLMYSLQFQQILLEERAQCIRLVEPDDRVVCLDLF